MPLKPTSKQVLTVGRRVMSEDKRKVKIQFNREALEESIERMKPELAACSKAAHKAKDAEADDDSDYADFDRVVELGSLVDCLSGMTGPHLMVLHEIAYALDELVHETEGAEPNVGLGD
jgi:hypothetical protein